MLIVTSNGIPPGYRIEAVLGEVMGMTVRSTNLGANLSASLRSMSGGEQEKFTKLAYDSRNEVMNRMWAECAKRGRERDRGDEVRHRRDGRVLHRGVRLRNRGDRGPAG